MGRVEGKVALVTGGSHGLGKAMAVLLAKEGAKVVITDIKDEEGEATAKEIGDAIYLHHDVAKEEEWEAVVAKTLDQFGRLDVLVNNAGVAMESKPEETSLEKWRWLMSINLDGVFLGTKHAILAMKKNNPSKGSIINLSSIEGLIGDPMLSCYNASKGGVRLYTKAVALYCAKNGLGIRVNSVHPGYIWTPMVEKLMADTVGIEEGRKQLAALHPIGDVGEPNDIAYGVLYLASDESKFVTGSELVIDGGYTAQ
ncbi:glucose 1-dehydrogenase [Methyloligella sp. 2.7D]|uniref:glucose 1-dehydrogenase n=1 Tax=unclassified Methyloligella TaxID=2625955 RepID=UPI00157D60C5|nr:glucose 1-dehydrogenase [Methyloligella sp. GL2]QKP76021.1 glucose 1-dehydrogenase [Methyloligella sp. GL2]